MIKQLFQFTTAIIFGLFHYTSIAQSCALNGTYTINPDLPSDSTNFISFTEAANQLNNCGISGSVVIYVKEGDYNEQIELDSINGTSPGNTITIQADPQNRRPVNWTYNATDESDNFLIRFSYVSYISVKGLSMEALNPSYGTVISLEGEGNHISIEENELTGVLSAANPTLNGDGGTAAVSVISALNSRYDHCVIENNNFQKGAVAVYLESESDNRAKGNRIGGNLMEDFGYAALYIYYQDSIEVTGNSVSYTSAISSPFGYITSGIEISGGSSVKVTNNKLDMYMSSPSDCYCISSCWCCLFAWLPRRSSLAYGWKHTIPFSCFLAIYSLSVGS